MNQPEEAVIISGPRKVEITTRPEYGERELTSEEDAELDLLLQAADKAAQSATALRKEAQVLNTELRRINAKHA